MARLIFSKKAPSEVKATEGGTTSCKRSNAPKLKAKESLLSTTTSKLDLYSLLGEADKLEDESIQFYTMVKSTKPEWANVLDDIIREELNHRGQIQALRATIDPEVQEALVKGHDEAETQLGGIEPGLQETLDTDDFERSVWDDEIADELLLDEMPDSEPQEETEDESLDEEDEE